MRIAWKAASVFTLLVLAIRVAADEQPQYLIALVVVAAEPSLLATALVMTVTAKEAFR